MLVLIVAVVVPVIAVATDTTDLGDRYGGPYFGRNNFPPACTRDNDADNKHNSCHRMATGLNGLDSPQVDVLVMVPVSPTAERDMRIMRQSVEMWEGGLETLAGQMGLDWLAEGVDFHVTIDYVDLEGGGEFTTYPIVDPEIVVIATNPVGGAGIGVDPVDFAYRVGLTDDGDAPCHPVSNPLDFEAWAALPGFDSHHGSRSGTYVEDCGGEEREEGGGGNICFAINSAVDPEPSTIDVFNLFDLVSHEFGHCLTLGHVGDGGEAILGNGWGAVPTNDIVSYNSDPEELTDVTGRLDIRVRPSFVNTFTNYTLTITVTPLDGAFGGLSAPDADFDGMPDDDDACPWYPGTGADGCTPMTPSQVALYVDGVAAGVAEVHAEYWRDSFSIPITAAAGTHQLRIDWVDGGNVPASRALTFTIA